MLPLRVGLRTRARRPQYMLCAYQRQLNELCAYQRQQSNLTPVSPFLTIAAAPNSSTGLPLPKSGPYVPWGVPRPLESPPSTGAMQYKAPRTPSGFPYPWVSFTLSWGHLACQGDVPRWGYMLSRVLRAPASGPTPTSVGAPRHLSHSILLGGGFLPPTPSVGLHRRRPPSEGLYALSSTPQLSLLETLILASLTCRATCHTPPRTLRSLVILVWSYTPSRTPCTYPSWACLVPSTSLRYTRTHDIKQPAPLLLCGCSLANPVMRSRSSVLLLLPCGVAVVEVISRLSR